MMLALLRPWVPLPILLLLLGLFVGAPLLIYLRSDKPLSPKLLGGLIGLRVLALLILFMLLMRPMRVETQRLEEKPHLAILIDNSRSMSQRDMPGGQSRIGAVEQFWRQHRRLLAELRKQFELTVFWFGRALADKPGARFAAKESATGIGPALRTFWRERRQGRVAGLVLFSDGNHNTGRAPEEVAREYSTGRVPIFPVLVGTERPTARMRDIELADLVAPASVDLGSRFEVTVELRALAAAGEPVEVNCFFADKKIDQRRVTIESDRGSRRLRFEVPTELKGTFTLRIKARPLRGEINLQNNQLETQIRVHSRKVLVLLVEGVLRWETKFLRQALEGDPGINLVVNYVVDPTARARLDQPRYREQFDVILIGDVALDQLPTRFRQDLPALVARRAGDAKRGRGLMLLGGWRAYSGGGWAGSRVARILPIELQPTAARFEGEVRARPTTAGHLHFALRFSEDPAENRRIWGRLPPLLDSEEAARVKQGGRVLLRGARHPLLVVAPYGLGRIATLTTASTWRWAMSEQPGIQKYHRLFWRQLVLWLARRDEESRGKVWLTLDPHKSQFSEGERLKLEVHVVDTRWRPDPSAVTQLVIQRAGGQPSRRTPTYDPLKRAFILPYRAGLPGSYKVSAVARRGGKQIGRDELSFTVRPQAEIELQDRLARAEILLSVAGRTRGRMVQLSGAAGLLRSLLDRKKTIVYNIQKQEDTWNHGFWLLLFVLLLGAEWWLRKTNGFV